MRRVFFSFHYEDVITFRVNVVRNHHVTKAVGEAGFFDASLWEATKLRGKAELKRLINSGLEQTSVTCVLIGTETWKRPWVRYEILKSYERGNKLFGIHINSISDKSKQTFSQGLDPFDHLGFYIDAYGKINAYQEQNGTKWNNYEDLVPEPKTFERKYWDKGYKLSEWVPCYDWVKENGYDNFASWIENTTS
jgi:hypothetical protein